MWNVPITGYSLEEYWEYLQIAECAGYGVKNFPGQSSISKGCGDYWQQTQRHFLAGAIAKAESRLQQDRWLGYPIRRQYYSKEFPYACQRDLGVRWVRCVGVHTIDILTSAHGLTLTDGFGVHHDPVTLTQVVTFTDPNELVLFYTGQRKYTIRPSSVVISAGVATIEIPRCRLLAPAYFIDYDDDADRPDYDVDANFIITLDTARDYCDPPGANLVWIRHCHCCGNALFSNCCAICGTSCAPTEPCGEELQWACGYVVNQELGFAKFEPVLVADDGSFTATSWAVCRDPDKLQVQFMAGYHDRYDDVDYDLARAIIALAHNNMPQDACACGQQELYFKRDVTPIEPAVQLGLGASTWGVNEAVQIVAERRVLGGGFL